MTCIIGIDALCYFGYDCGNLLLRQVLIKDKIVDGDTLHGMKNILNYSAKLLLFGDIRKCEERFLMKNIGVFGIVFA